MIGNGTTGVTGTGEGTGAAIGSGKASGAGMGLAAGLGAGTGKTPGRGKTPGIGISPGKNGTGILRGRRTVKSPSSGSSGAAGAPGRGNLGGLTGGAAGSGTRNGLSNGATNNPGKGNKGMTGGGEGAGTNVGGLRRGAVTTTSIAPSPRSMNPPTSGTASEIGRPVGLGAGSRKPPGGALIPKSVSAIFSGYNKPPMSPPMRVATPMMRPTIDGAGAGAGAGAGSNAIDGGRTMGPGARNASFSPSIASCCSAVGGSKRAVGVPTQDLPC